MKYKTVLIIAAALMLSLLGGCSNASESVSVGTEEPGSGVEGITQEAAADSLDTSEIAGESASVGTDKSRSGVEGISQESAADSLDTAELAGESVSVGTEESGSDVEGISQDAAADSFYITEITDEIFDRIYGKSFKEDCTLPREELRYLHVLHKDLDGNEHEGEMIVNRHIAEDVLEILKQLYDADYPIEKIRLVDEYDADDEASMEDNNSSAFNFRFISHTTRVSKHGLGLAVDINTLYNPYTKIVDGERIIEPITAEPYLDRDADFPYKIDENDLCYKLFTERGFEWGGAWKNRKDYQHFEIPDGKIAEWYPEN